LLKLIIRSASTAKTVRVKSKRELKRQPKRQQAKASAKMWPIIRANETMNTNEDQGDLNRAKIELK